IPVNIEMNPATLFSAHFSIHIMDVAMSDYHMLYSPCILSHYMNPPQVSLIFFATVGIGNFQIIDFPEMAIKKIKGCIHLSPSVDNRFFGHILPEDFPTFRIVPCDTDRTVLGS